MSTPIEDTGARYVIEAANALDGGARRYVWMAETPEGDTLEAAQAKLSEFQAQPVGRLSDFTLIDRRA